MSPSASSSLIGRASPELLSDWSRHWGGGGEAFSRVWSSGLEDSQLGQAGRGQLRCSSGEEREWEREEGVEGGCRRAHTVSHSLFFSGAFFKGLFGSPLGPFEVFFVCGHSQVSTMFLAPCYVILFGGLISRSSEFLGPDFITVGA